MFSPKTSTNKKPPYYYIQHPHEAYLEGYNDYLGNANNVHYQAYLYYLPTETIKLIPVINDYFANLISGCRLHPERQRRKSYLESIDTALQVLQRTHFIQSSGETLVLGSRFIKPIAWAIIGRDEPCNLWQYKFADTASLVERYTRKYELPCHCSPVCLYHLTKGREVLKLLCDKELLPGENQHLHNKIMAAAIHFLVDILSHCGPDMNHFFDLFTNDLYLAPENVDIHLWRQSRECALQGGTVKFTNKKSLPQASSSQPVPPPPSRKIRVVVTEEKVDDITKGVRTVRFNTIRPEPRYDDYRYYYEH